MPATTAAAPKAASGSSAHPSLVDREPTTLLQSSSSSTGDSSTSGSFESADDAGAGAGTDTDGGAGAAGTNRDPARAQDRSRIQNESQLSQHHPQGHGYHAHRQNHNSSKLPAFRFADFQQSATKQQNLGLPGLQHQQFPPSPVSPGDLNASTSSSSSASSDSGSSEDLLKQKNKTHASHRDRGQPLTQQGSASPSVGTGGDGPTASTPGSVSAHGTSIRSQCSGSKSGAESSDNSGSDEPRSVNGHNPTAGSAGKGIAQAPARSHTTTTTTANPKTPAAPRPTAHQVQMQLQETSPNSHHQGSASSPPQPEQQQQQPHHHYRRNPPSQISPPRQRRQLPPHPPSSSRSRRLNTADSDNNNSDTPARPVSRSSSVSSSSSAPSPRNPVTTRAASTAKEAAATTKKNPLPLADQSAIEVKQSDCDDISAPATQPPRTATRATTTATTITRPAATQHTSATNTTARKWTRHSTTSSSSDGSESAAELPPALNSQGLRENDATPASPTAAAAATEPSQDSATKEGGQGQRELILPKTLQSSSPAEDKRQSSIRARPPVSFRQASNQGSRGSVRVAPIRSFRSSGSRRSFGLEMGSSPTQAGDSSGDDYSHANTNQRDRTLRALEGKQEDASSRMPSRRPDAMRQPGGAPIDNDDTAGDVFMKIAQEEAPRRRLHENVNMTPIDTGSAISRVTRSNHRRPLSTSIPSSRQQNSPPRLRRLSDQQDTSRPVSRQLAEGSSVDNQTRTYQYRSLSRDKNGHTPSWEESRQSRPTSAYRSPITPRSFNFQDAGTTENSTYARRRTSITDSIGGHSTTRNSAHKQPPLSYNPSRIYNSSPLVPRSADPNRHDAHGDGHHGLEGTESTASTTAPSTVWDELDDLKSRIHRLELTGKLPSTSTAAINKVLDERPPTATNTTVSTSPKQVMKNTTVQTSTAAPSLAPATAPTEVGSTVSAARDTQPLLLSAVDRSKALLSEEVSQALETAASDAVSLISMMGTAGQPGPISSGASSLGAGGNLTDRQLRRRAEGICRSLTELVLALSEEAGSPQNRKVSADVFNENAHKGAQPATPNLTKNFPSLPPPRRGSVTAHDEPIERPPSIPSPRAMSKLEQRRSSMLNSSTLPSPRAANGSAIPPSPSTVVGRKSSLLIGRTRRATTEEPEETRPSSRHLRTRRAGTEEPEENRRTSFFRDQQAAEPMDDDVPILRAPSRATTDVNATRASSHQYQSPSSVREQESSSTLGTSALPRRRIGSSMLGGSRLTSGSSPFSGRRYLERSSADRDGNSVADKLAEDRGQQQPQQQSYRQAQPSLLNRTASLLRRPTRESSSTSLHHQSK